MTIKLFILKALEPSQAHIPSHWNQVGSDYIFDYFLIYMWLLVLLRPSFLREERRFWERAGRVTEHAIWKGKEEFWRWKGTRSRGGKVTIRATKRKLKAVWKCPKETCCLYANLEIWKQWKDHFNCLSFIFFPRSYAAKMDSRNLQP